jgi:hypothetical protein
MAIQQLFNAVSGITVGSTPIQVIDSTGSITAANISFTGALTTTSTAPNNLTALNLTGNIQSNSSTTGTLIVTGGVGISGNTYTQGNNVTSGTIISTIAQGNAPFQVISSTPVPILSIGGNANTATNANIAATLNIANSATNTSYQLLFASGPGTTNQTYTSSQFVLNPSNGNFAINGVFQAPTGGITSTTIGATSPSTGNFTTLSATTISGAGFTTYLASPPVIGGTTANIGNFTTLNATTINATTITGSGISASLSSPPSIGSTTPNTGSFTTLSASSTVSGNGFINYFASPTPLGSTTPNTGSFTTLTTSGNIITSGAVISNSIVNTIGQFNAVNGKGTTWYNAGFRNDSINVYLIGTNSSTTGPGAASAPYNAYRPFAWNLNAGNVTIDGSNAGVLIGTSSTNGVTINGGKIAASGGIDKLTTVTGAVSVISTAPSVDQILVATSPTTATWQNVLVANLTAPIGIGTITANTGAFTSLSGSSLSINGTIQKTALQVNLVNAEAFLGKKVLVTFPNSGVYSGTVRVYTNRPINDGTGIDNTFAEFKICRTGSLTNNYFYINLSEVSSNFGVLMEWYFDSSTGTPYLRVGQFGNSFTWFIDSELTTMTSPTAVVDLGITPPTSNSVLVTPNVALTYSSGNISLSGNISITGAISGSGSGLTALSVPNTALQGSGSHTIGTTAIALGGTTTTLAGLTNVTSTNFTGTASYATDSGKLGGVVASSLSVNYANSAGTASTAANATLAGGLAIATGTNNVANQLVRTDTNGYIQAGWINTISGDNQTTAISRVYASSDGYIRYYTLANFTSQVVTASNIFTAISSQSNSDWYRTSGATGWFNSTYAVGIYSSGAGLVQTYGGASFQVNGTMYATGNVTAYYSDKRLKINLGKIPNALEKVNLISGIYYKNNEIAVKYGFTDQNQQVGVIAQEVEEIMPEVIKPAPFDVGHNEDGSTFSISGENYKTVQYDKLVPLLIEAIKELNAKVAYLESKVK